MLAIFSGEVVAPPEELAAAGNRTPSPKKTATALMNHFLDRNSSAMSARLGDHVRLAYTHQTHSPLFPRSFGVKDDIFCLFQGVLDNLGMLRKEYGLDKSANEVVQVIEAYRALRDRAPYPPSRMVGHLIGNFAFVVFDNSTSSLFVASDESGRVPLYWGITADGCVAFADDVQLLRGACGKSLAPFPHGCFFSTAVGELRSYENPKNKIAAVPASDDEICGATFKVEVSSVVGAGD